MSATPTNAQMQAALDALTAAGISTFELRAYAVAQELIADRNDHDPDGTVWECYEADYKATSEDAEEHVTAEYDAIGTWLNRLGHGEG